MNRDKHSLVISVSLEFLDGKRINYDYGVSRQQFEDALAPLPRCREIDIREAVRAKELMVLREQMADYIGKAISMAVMSACAERDTVDGYSKRER